LKLAIVSFLVTFIGGAAFVACPPQKQSQTLDAGVIAPYVEIRNETAGAVGSGAVVVRKGVKYVLTARHVVQDDTGTNVDEVKAIKRRDGTATEWTVKKWATSIKYDLALYAFSDQSVTLSAATIAPKDVKLAYGQEVYYVGTPKRFHGFFGHSDIAHPHYKDAEGTWLVINGQAWYGNSGCGVYINSNGYQLVGICSRLCWNDARTPIRCVPPVAINEFLEESVK
jgi:hypothetical protein